MLQEVSFSSSSIASTGDTQQHMRQRVFDIPNLILTFFLCPESRTKNNCAQPSGSVSCGGLIPYNNSDFKRQDWTHNYNGITGLKLGCKMSHLGLSLYHVRLIYIQPKTKSEGFKLVKIVYISQRKTKRNKRKEKKRKESNKRNKRKEKRGKSFWFFNK